MAGLRSGSPNVHRLPIRHDGDDCCFESCTTEVSRGDLLRNWGKIRCHHAEVTGFVAFLVSRGRGPLPEVDPDWLKMGIRQQNVAHWHEIGYAWKCTWMMMKWTTRPWSANCIDLVFQEWKYYNNIIYWSLIIARNLSQYARFTKLPMVHYESNVNVTNMNMVNYHTLQELN